MNDESRIGRGMHDDRDVLWLDGEGRSQKASTFNRDFRQPSSSFHVVRPEHGERAVIDERKVGCEKCTR